MGIRNLTISLDGVAIGRVPHINVYDEGDPVQVKGRNSFSVVFPSDEKGGQAPPGSIFLTGEYGRAGRLFKKALNIKTTKSNGVLGDFHNSHNRVYEWIHKLPKQKKR